MVNLFFELIYYSIEIWIIIFHFISIFIFLQFHRFFFSNYLQKTSKNGFLCLNLKIIPYNFQNNQVIFEFFECFYYIFVNLLFVRFLSFINFRVFEIIMKNKNVSFQYSGYYKTIIFSVHVFLINYCLFLWEFLNY